MCVEKKSKRKALNLSTQGNDFIELFKLIFIGLVFGIIIFEAIKHIENPFMLLLREKRKRRRRFFTIFTMFYYFYGSK